MVRERARPTAFATRWGNSASTPDFCPICAAQSHPSARDLAEELRAFARHMGADLVWPVGTSRQTTGDWARYAGIGQFVEATGQAR